MHPSVSEVGGGLGLVGESGPVGRQVLRLSAPGRNRTCDARFRKPTLYPLSYEGGDGAKRGAKLRCWVRPHVRLRLSACFEARRRTGRVPLDSPHDRKLARLPFVFFRSTVTALAIAASSCGAGSASLANSDASSSPTSNGLASDASSTTQAPVTTTDAPITTEPTASTPATTLSSTGEPSDCERLAEFDDGAWFIVNDGVMGGRSQAEGAVEDGVLTWRGTIVTAGGGFSSIRGPVDGMFAGATSLLLRIRTDGRAYELLANDALVNGARSAGLSGSGTALVIVIPIQLEGVKKRIQSWYENKHPEFNIIETKFMNPKESDSEE